MTADLWYDCWTVTQIRAEAVLKEAFQNQVRTL